MTSSECTNSVFDITEEKDSFAITIPSHWENISNEESFDELNKLLELRSRNGIELHVEQVRKKCIISIYDYSLSSLETFKN